VAHDLRADRRLPTLGIGRAGGQQALPLRRDGHRGPPHAHPRHPDGSALRRALIQVVEERDELIGVVEHSYEVRAAPASSPRALGARRHAGHAREKDAKACAGAPSRTAPVEPSAL